MIATPMLRPAPQNAAPQNAADDRAQAFGLVTAAFLIFSVARGGSSVDPMSIDLVALAAAPLLGVAAWRSINRPRAGRAACPMLILFAAFALAAVQLLPLSPRLWSSLPGRQVVIDGYEAAGMALPWLPISLSPSATWSAARGLLAPAAMFAGMLTLNSRSRMALALAVVAIAAASTVLGMAQLASGSQTALRLYPLTDTAAAVGLFANRNHQGALLVASLPLAALVATIRSGDRGPPPFFWTVVAFALCVVLVVGVAAARSRAGILLLAPAAIGALLVALRGAAGKSGGTWIPAASLAGATLLSAALVVTFNYTPLADRFDTGLAEDLRYQLTPDVLKAGMTFAPFGSGLGSFPAIYAMFESPDRVADVFVNHAHNDYAELWLEAGWLGLATVGAFVVWWIARTRRILLTPDHASSALALGGSFIVGLFLIHSMVDYPLRTPALATLFAFAAGLMTSPPDAEPQSQA